MLAWCGLLKASSLQPQARLRAPGLPPATSCTWQAEAPSCRLTRGPRRQLSSQTRARRTATQRSLQVHPRQDGRCVLGVALC